MAANRPIFALRPVLALRPILALRAAAVLAIGVLAAGTAGCAVTVDNRGNAPDPELVEQLRPGKQNREQVVRMIGTPSTVATFDKETWYYISARTSTTAFKKTKLKDRQILTIRFNKQGVVEEITKFDASHGRLVTLVNRKTPTKGKDLTIIQQLVGNVGRFSLPENDKDRTGY